MLVELAGKLLFRVPREAIPRVQGEGVSVVVQNSLRSYPLGCQAPPGERCCNIELAGKPPVGMEPLNYLEVSTSGCPMCFSNKQSTPEPGIKHPSSFSDPSASLCC